MQYGHSRQRIKKVAVACVVAMLFGALLFHTRIYIILSDAFEFVRGEKSTEEALVLESCTREIQSVNSSPAATAIGNSYFGGDRRYNRDCARIAYMRATEIDPKGDRYTWYQLGRVNFLDGNFDQALQNLTTQLRYFNEDVPNVHYMLGLTYGYRAREGGGESDWKKTEEHFQRFITIDPRAPWPRVDLAWAYFAQGKYETMIPIVVEGLQFSPTNPWLLNMYGLALLNTGKEKEAYVQFKKAGGNLQTLTPEDWGRSYPGNDPADWEHGLSEMRRLIEVNLELASTSMKSTESEAVYTIM